MSSKTNELVRNLTEAIVNTGKKKTSPYDTSATVMKVEGGKAYVHIPGGVDETPADLTINANPGDTVQVRVAGGRAFLIGNRTSPPTDDATAIRASKRAVEAYEQAVDAQKSALDAADAAEAAQESADQAAEAASNAQESADIAHTAAENAQADADSAQASATSALNSANNALTQLSIVEDVAGTLNWIREHGTYVAATDTTVNPDTIYFEMEGEDYVPIANPDPSANPASEGWYILDVTDSQSEYIMAHLAVTSAGLWVLPSGQWGGHSIVDSDGNTIVDSSGDPIVDWTVDPQNAIGYKVLLSASGMTVFDGNGVAVASYGAEMVLGRLDDGNLIARPTGIAVRDGLTELATFSASGSRIGSEAEGEYNLATTSNAINYKVGEIPIIKNIATFTPDSSVLGYSYYQNMMATSNGRSYVMYGSAPDADNDNPTGTKTANATIGVNGGTNHEALVYCGSDAYNGDPAIIASINGIGRLILTEQNAYLYNSSSNTMTTVNQNGNIQSAGQAVPCVLPWTFSNQTVTANTRGTISNLPISGLPSGAQICGVVVTKTPNNHWVRAYAYAQDNTKIAINYVNENSGAITGAFSVLIFFTL